MRSLLVFVLMLVLLAQKTYAQEDETIQQQDLKLPVHILTATDSNDEDSVFHSDEVWVGAAKEKWFGLFQNKDGYYLRKTRLAISQAHDTVTDHDENGKDDPGKKTGWRVLVKNPDKLILLMSGADLKEDPVAQVAVKEQVNPNEQQTFRFKDKDYTFAATAEKIEDFYDGKNYVERSLGPATKEDSTSLLRYHLVLKTSRDGKTMEQEIINERYSDGIEPQLILFAGDLDRDGLPDFVLDPGGENTSQPSLFLSKSAAKGQLVKFVGRHMTNGC